MTNKVALIVVHEFAGRPWDGKTGLANVSNVAVVSPNINMTFSLPDGNALLSKVVGLQNTITTYGTNNWMGVAVCPGGSAVAGNGTGYGSGYIALAAVLTAVRITTVNGTDTFDAGSINILYE
jgi:hypothetical protein